MARRLALEFRDPPLRRDQPAMPWRGIRSWREAVRLWREGFEVRDTATRQIWRGPTARELVTHGE